ncbi:hypothetical protein [Paenibacillus arenilitoris]|uniref:Uncharacterized protein n=1 Tax=Paenibacillus arenilitoris TaxID=2772299 RepID=A0A927CW54_9BACL|nr:hypothetical protein [Paenibacillus arenilitoris]MBD2872936.1 hypothetical protein [Paenibacillus arenilitoris]
MSDNGYDEFYDGLDVDYEPDDPTDDLVCSGCLKDFTCPETEIGFLVPRMSPDGVKKLGVRYYCKPVLQMQKRGVPMDGNLAL